MSKRLQKNTALAIALCLLCVLLCGYAAIDTDIPGDRAEVIYDKVPVYVNGEVQSSGYMIGGVAYMPIRSFCGALNLGMTVSWAPDTSVMTGVADGVTLTAGENDAYLTVNGRCFYVENGIVNYQGKLLVPVRVACNAFHVGVDWDPETGAIDLTTDELQVCENGDSFYNYDDLYWLSRIINAESRDQSMEGKIGVGNVVLNRVKNERFPDTVKNVVFDSSNGVQFSPVSMGTIYDEPSADSIAAAKICLEGNNLMGESLYFVNPEIGASKWFEENCVFVATVGDHSFYA